MSATEITYVLLFASLAFAAAISLVVGFAGGIHVEPYIRKLASAWLPTLLLFGLAGGTLVSGRNASLYGLASNFLVESGHGRDIWVLRIATALAVGISVLVVSSALIRKADRQTAARPLFLAYSLYFLFAYVVSGIFGTEVAISHKSFYPFLVIFALYITSDQDADLLIRIVRDGLFLFLVAGLCLILLMPDLVIQRGYAGFIPGLSFRYWGLASHANNIGPLAIFFFLVLCWIPYKTRLLMSFAIAAVAITLIIAQSKTALGAAMIVAGVFMMRWWLQAAFSCKFGRVGSGLAIGFGMLVLVGVLATFVADIYSGPLDSLLERIQGRGTLLTGRELIWSITIAEWEKSPVFGYGPALWGEEFSAKFGYLGVASNAHNQFFDTLGSSGLLGATSFVVYALVLTRYALLLAGPSKWVSIAFLVFFAVRSVTEVPLKTMNIMTSDFFMHAVVIGLFMRAAARCGNANWLSRRASIGKN